MVGKNPRKPKRRKDEKAGGTAELKRVAKFARNPAVKSRGQTALAVEDIADRVLAQKNATAARLRLYRLILENAVDMGSTDQFFDNFKPTKVLSNKEKDSASSSVIAFGTLDFRYAGDDASFKEELALLRAKPVAVKYMVASAGLEFKLKELQIYRAVAKLVENNVTPNVMLYIYGFDIDNPQQKFRARNPKMDLRLQQRIRRMNAKNPPRAIVVVTEAGDGELLWKLVEERRLPQCEFVAVMFQVLFTLTQLQSIGVTHYDTHLGNIFMQRVSKSDKPFLYFVDDDTAVWVKNETFFPRLYDWDLAYTRDGDQQVYLTDKAKGFCYGAGICPYVNPPYDAMRFLYTIATFQEHLPPAIYPLIRSFLLFLHKHLPKGTSLRSDLRMRFDRPYMCHKFDPKTDRCSGGIRTVLGKAGIPFTEDDTEFLPWPYSAMRWTMGFAKKNPQSCMKILNVAEIDDEYRPGGALFETNVFFDSNVDRTKVKQKLQAKRKTFKPRARGSRR